MNEKDEAKIRKLLKASPPLTPPESFYRGVLQKIERKGHRAEAKTPWYWGYPAKALTAACLVMVVVLITRETNRSNLESLQPKLTEVDELKSSVSRNEPLSTTAPEGVAREILERKEKVAAHIAPEKQSAIAGFTNTELAIPQAQPITQQARDTASGMASQGSFLQEQNALADKKQVPQAPALAGKSLGGIRAKDMPLREDLSNATSLAGGGGELASGAAGGSGQKSAATAENLAGPKAAAEPAEFPVAASELDQQLAASANEATLAKERQKGFEIAGPVAVREILEKVIPVYPDWALDQGMEGTVRIYVRVTPQGTVNPQIRITRTTGYPALDQVAVDAVKKWKFSPAPQDTWGIITFQFPPEN